MKTKRNIAICFGALLILMGAFASTAAAENVQLGLSVSPENLVIGTNARWASVVFHVEDAYDGCPYTAANIDPTSITLMITDSKDNQNFIATEQYDRFEITDADGDGLDQELVLIYLASDLLNTKELELDNKGLNFAAEGSVGTNTFTANCLAKTMLKGGSDKSKKPADKGPVISPGKGKGSGARQNDEQVAPGKGSSNGKSKY
ncbi:MAG: hypothetical protein PHF18_05450 [Methanosarcina sp.]|uniref:hypothetical protein n=1 Tax=Methanosarcina sp. TaxID=2213 RepID=UPI0026371319|nr:hypothetical protein [Methanosarcina sp.]MDD3246285.1 hypothetical protein [Methanosarcina sp.]MDD4250379.1 hypothetical protein [Methanosarcina sp.]